MAHSWPKRPGNRLPQPKPFGRLEWAANPRRTEAAEEALDQLRRITLEDGERAEWWAELHNGANERPEDWVITVGKRGELVAQALRHSLAEAVALLDKWNDDQRAELRLPRYA